MRLLVFAICLIVGSTVQGAAGGETRSASESPAPVAKDVTFEAHVRPILKAHCFHCHGEDGHMEAGLDLRLVRSIVSGGDSGSAVMPGRHAESLLYQRLAEGDMPPGDKKPSAGELATIARWIDQGARTARPEPDSPELAAITDEERSHWAFQPVRRPAAPVVQQAERVTTPIDAFLLARLEAAGLTFAPEADRAALARRAYFDLWGLPPTPEQVAEFVDDGSPDAWERLIDRLLASPHYGERWGRHWLDVAGYADSDGASERDLPRDFAYKYRDWVVRAFNADKPLDEFIREQLAGDEMLTPPYKNLSPDEIDLLVATGFLRMGPDGTGDSSLEANAARNEVVAETIKIVSTSLLGLSVGCAQCHTHRFDPIPQQDYYRLRAIFEPAYDWKNWRSPRSRLVSLLTDEQLREIKAVEVRLQELKAQQDQEFVEMADRGFEIELAKLPEDIRDAFRAARNADPAKLTAEQKALLKKYPGANINTRSVRLYFRKETLAVNAKYEKLREEINRDRPADDFAMALTEVPGQVPVTQLFFRGDPSQPRQQVAPGELTVLCSAGTPEIPVNDPVLPTTGRRLAYARHLTDGQHPLVGRVLVNRVWLHHFGRGIVATPAEFGLAGEEPSHPELLDWLASELVAGGWRLKRLHKLLMLSTAYRQSSLRRAEQDAVDPENRLLARMNVRRLQAEELRDAILKVAGCFNGRMYGAGVPVSPDETGQIIVAVDTRDTAGRPTGKVVPLGDEVYRRSLYVQVRRSMPLGMLEAFDAPTMSPNCEQRTVSTVAPQSLLLMNNEFVLEQAEALARRLLAQPADQPLQHVRRAWQLALGVEPTASQLERAAAFVARQEAVFAAGPAVSAPATETDPPLDAHGQALASLCQALFSSNAFLYID